MCQAVWRRKGGCTTRLQRVTVGRLGDDMVTNTIPKASVDAENPARDRA
jgi:hypothetical protein